LKVGRALDVEDVRDGMGGLDDPDDLGVPDAPDAPDALGALGDLDGRVVGGGKCGIQRCEAVHIDYTATLDQNGGRCDFRGLVDTESVEVDQDMLGVVVNDPGSGLGVLVVVVVGKDAVNMGPGGVGDICCGQRQREGSAHPARD